MINTAILITTIVILVLQFLLSKKYNSINIFKIESILNFIIVITLCVVLMINYDTINNSAPVVTIFIPVIVYGIILEVVYYIIYRFLRKK